MHRKFTRALHTALVKDALRCEQLARRVADYSARILQFTARALSRIRLAIAVGALGLRGRELLPTTYRR